MRFSLWPDMSRPWEEVAALAAYAEDTGWDRVYTYDHFMPHSLDEQPRGGSVLEGWTVLAALAARTSRIGLGTLVLGNLYRHPAVLANMAATLDHVSAGRLVLGVGAGWQVNEHVAYGIELTPPPTRLDQFEEACAVLTSLLHQDRTTFAGSYYRLVDAPCEPKPVQARLPLLIGGRGERRTLRIAARYADEWNAWTTPQSFRQKRVVLERHCQDVGRDPGSIARSTQAVVITASNPRDLPTDIDPTGRTPYVVGTPPQVLDTLADYRSAGADEFIVPDEAEIPLAQRLDQLELLRSEVLATLRDDRATPPRAPVPGPA